MAILYECCVTFLINDQTVACGMSDVAGASGATNASKLESKHINRQTMDSKQQECGGS